MNGPLPDWTPAQAPDRRAEGLRERKKRLMRQQLSDTATAMFLDRGFDGVRVAEVAAACGVSEKTVFNYFPVKEALVMDRLEATLAAARRARRPCAHAGPGGAGGTRPRLGAMTGWLAAQEDATQGREAIRRFGDLIRATPALRAYQADMTDQAASAAAGSWPRARGMAADDPEPQIAQGTARAVARRRPTACAGTWTARPRPALLHELVTADVRRAARLMTSRSTTSAARCRRSR